MIENNNFIVLISKNNLPTIIVAVLIVCVGFYIFSADTIFAEEEKKYNVELFSVLDSAYDPFDSQAMLGIYRVNKNDKIIGKINHVKKDDIDELSEIMNTAAITADLIFCVGYSMKDVMVGSSVANPDVAYLTVDLDYSQEELTPNMANIVFRSNEPSYVAGYVAGMTTKSNTIGFVGGIESYIMDGFYYGFLAGINKAEKERGVKINLLSGYVGNYDDIGKASEIAKSIYNKGADIIYSVSGGAGLGTIMAAKEMDKYVIGVDVDQNYIAPDNVIFSVIKDIATATAMVINDYSNGINYGGKIISVGYSENSVGLVTFLEVVDDRVIEKADKLEEAIVNGEIIVPQNAAEYNAYLKTGY